jgi:salicylate hydroxylase
LKNPRADLKKKLLQTTSKWGMFDHPLAPRYHNGRVCVLGDAAHASTPHQGAGAGQALEDALILSRLLQACESKESVTKALEAYDEVRRPRSQKVCTTSRYTGDLLDLQDEQIWRDGELDLNELFTILDQSPRYIWEEDLSVQIEKALNMFRDLGK